MSDSIDQSSDLLLPNIIDSDELDETANEQKTSANNPKFSSIITDDNYGRFMDDHGQNVKVTKYTLSNKQGVIIEIINYGAAIVSCWVPNTLGKLDDVLLGFDTIEGYRSQNIHSIGGTLGRVTDYISHGLFKNENGDVKELSKNRGVHHFNGGERGFDKVMWDGYVSGDELILTYSSKDGEEGYPGTLQTRITFCLTCKNELVIDYVGMTSKSTPVNITSNMFFNLAGHDTGESEIANHSLMINADEYVAIKLPERRPVGLFKNVQHTCLDLRVPRSLKKAFTLVPGFGYNHSFKLFKGKEQKAFNLAASLVHKPSGRLLDIYTDMPCVFVNTAQDFPNYGKMFLDEEVLKITEIDSPIATFGNSGNEQQTNSIGEENTSKSELDIMLPEDVEGEGEHEEKFPSVQLNQNVQDNINPIIGKSNTVYRKHSGICIRPQLFPDAVTHKNFTNTILKPSNFFSQRVVYKFGVIDSIKTE